MNDTRHPILFITGLPGSGKTRLAKTLQDEAVDEVIVVDSDELGELNEDLSLATLDRALKESLHRPVIACSLFIGLTKRLHAIDLSLTVWIDLPLHECISRKPDAYAHVTKPSSLLTSGIPAFKFVPPRLERCLVLRNTDNLGYKVLRGLLTFLGTDVKATSPTP